MTNSPFYNALLAVLYIVVIVSVLNFGSQWAQNQEDNMLMPVGMLSLFVVSAAAMGYIVLYQPLTMYLDGKRSEAVSLFLRTIAIFAVFAVLILICAFIVL
jgi:hypothetical protein